MNHDERRRVALWRYAILGPLVSADLDYGDRLRLFKEASARLYEHPRGRSTRRSARTIEGWYYAYRKRGLRGLEPRTRSDAAKTRAIDDELAALIVRAKRERPQRSIRQVIKILVRAKKARPGQLHPATVHRILRRAGVPTRRVRADDEAGRLHARERRSFITRHAGDLWIGDFMHGPHVAHEGRRRRALLVSILDCATRYILASTFVLVEDAIQHEAFLKRALRIHGRPRRYYVDGGAPYRADSLGSICADLGIERRLTGPNDPEAKGAIERWHRTWREELGVELQGQTLALDQLNTVHQAWLETDYHARLHGTTDRAPREHFLEEVAAGVLRPLPRGIDLDVVFLHRAHRRVRLDGTVSLHGRRLEVQPELVGHTVELRFDPCDPDMRPRVFVEGSFVCDTTPQDLLRNATRRRRALRGGDALPVLPSGLDPIGDLVREHRRASAPELPEIEVEDDEEIEIEIDDDDDDDRKREDDEEERR